MGDTTSWGGNGTESAATLGEMRLECLALPLHSVSFDCLDDTVAIAFVLALREVNPSKIDDGLRIDGI